MAFLLYFSKNLVINSKIRITYVEVTVVPQLNIAGERRGCISFALDLFGYFFYQEKK